MNIAKFFVDLWHLNNVKLYFFGKVQYFFLNRHIIDRGILKHTEFLAINLFVPGLGLLQYNALWWSDIHTM